MPEQTDLIIVFHAQSLHSLPNRFPQRLFHNLVDVGITLLLHQDTQVHVVEMGVDDIRSERRRSIVRGTRRAG